MSAPATLLSDFKDRNTTATDTMPSFSVFIRIKQNGSRIYSHELSETARVKMKETLRTYMRTIIAKNEDWVSVKIIPERGVMYVNAKRDAPLIELMDPMEYTIPNIRMKIEGDTYRLKFSHKYD